VGPLTGVVRHQWELRGRCGQRGANPLETEIVFVFVEMVRNQRYGRSRFAASAAAAECGIPFVRRTPRSSFSGWVIRAASPAVTPGRRASSTSR